MSYDLDQQLGSPGTGEADWDTLWNANATILARGYHTTAMAGHAVITADVLWMSSGGYFYKYDPNSTTIKPMALALTAAASGESTQVLLHGVVRSLTATVPGREYFTSAAAPGVIVTTPGQYPIGYGVTLGGLRFAPVTAVLSIDPASITVVVSIDPTRSIVPVASGTAQIQAIWNGKIVEFDFATGVTLTIPTNAVLSLPIGFQMDMWQRGAGQVSVISGGALTLRSYGDKYKLTGQYAMGTLVKRATDEWFFGGERST